MVWCKFCFFVRARYPHYTKVFFVQIDNLSIMEINEIRPFFTRANYEMSKLNHAEAEAATRAEDDEDTQYDEPSQNY